MINEAISNGITDKGRVRLRTLLGKYQDCFGIKLGGYPPAKAAPLQLKLKEDARPFRYTQRRYAPKRRQFLLDTVRELELIGAVYKNPTARWTSPVLALAKPGTDTYRFKVDLRGPISKTEPVQSAMPHLESIPQQCEGSKLIVALNFVMVIGNSFSIQTLRR